jgi:hypothetical protein
VKTDPRELTFIVRLRQEASATETQWRGSVQEVSSGGRRFITGTREISEFIAAYLRDEERAEQR